MRVDELLDILDESGRPTGEVLAEIEEELGLHVTPERLVSLGTIRVEQQLPAGYDRELHEVFLLADDTPPEKLRLQKEEVESVFRLNLDDVETLYATGEAPAREYAQGRSFTTRIHLTEFVPKNEDHLAQITSAARQLLSGTTPPPPF